MLKRKNKFSSSFKIIFYTVCIAVLASGCSDKSSETTQGKASKTDSNKAEIQEVEMVVFKPPSLGAFLPPIIEEQKLDINNGVDIKFVERPPDAYNTEFASGQYPLGGSAALLSEGLRLDRGVKVSYLFNLFDFWGTVVSSDSKIQKVEDLEGKTIAAAKSTTNFAMFQYFVQKSGVDLNKAKLLNADTAALMTYAEANRADAVQLWEPGYSTLINKSPDKYHQVDFGFENWEKYTGSSDIPYLGVAAHQDWIKSNKELIPKIYKTYEEAASWIQSNPEDAAKIIASKIPGGDASVIKDLIGDNNRLGMNVKPASEIEDDIRSVFKAGMEINYLEKMPEDSIIYKESLE